MQKTTESKATVSQPQTSAAQRQSARRKDAVGFSSPHDNLAQLAQMIHQSPRMQAERSLQTAIDNSPRMVAQRRQLEGMFGRPMQRKGIDEEEPLQGKFEAVQKQKPEEEELLQGKFTPIQRMNGLEEEEPLQGKFETIQRKEAEEEEPLQGKFPEGMAATQLVKEAAPQQNNTGLPDNLKAGVENLSGLAMDDVKVHYNSSKPAQLQALAYAQGPDIHVAPGQAQHVPHEAWHVVQQKQGRVKPTMQMKGGVSLNDDAGLEREADLMGAKAAKAYSAPYANNSFSAETGDTRSVQLKSITFRPVVQRWIMMAKDLVLGDEKLKDDKQPEHKDQDNKRPTLEDHINKTSALFEGKSKKPIDSEFVLLSKFEEAKEKVAKALEFLNINKRGKEECITITDVEPLLRSWMGVVPDYSVEILKNKMAEKNKMTYGVLDPIDPMIGPKQYDMTDEVLGPVTGPEQYDIRAASGMPAEMRYYVTFEELAWALVQASGLQAAPNMFDDYYAEIAVANSVSISENIHTNLESALKRIFAQVAEINVQEMKGSPDYAFFHGIKTWEQFKEKYEEKYMPDSFIGLISLLHDIKSYFAISKHKILSKKPEDIVVRGSKKEGGSNSNKKGDASMSFPEEIRINKEDMRYNLGTVDEADPFVLFMRERGRSLWAAPSFTTVSMLEMVKECGGNKNELTSVAYGIFAFWCIHYSHTATPIHTFHEVMAAAQAYGVAYDPNKSVVDNANKEGLLRSKGF